MELTTCTFSGHESFPFRNTWLTKGVENCAPGDPAFFSREDAMVELGVGKNMVRSIRHWCLATGMLEEDPAHDNNRGRFLRPTDLAQRIFLGGAPWDHYLEDIGTLWLIHWKIATNPERATTWYYAFNEFHQPEFTKGRMEEMIGNFVQRLDKVRVSDDTLKRDVDIFLRTYVGAASGAAKSYEDTLDCPLVELGLLWRQESDGVYAFMRESQDTLPPAIFLYALWDYAQRWPNKRSFSFHELAYGPLGPGNVFKLDEAGLGLRLDGLAELTFGAWQFSETAGLRRVLFTGTVDHEQIMKILDDYYRSR